MRQAQAYVQGGRRWVVDMDLEKFFDRVNHDIMMSRLSRKIKDVRLLRLIRRYLEADMVSGKVVTKRREGMPQGSPLSPLLSTCC
ncbi:reverse transcriptase domain-containing protein [Sodalis ligni]|uniref:reverse transcriptase domain-containing protein n=1 Tax=Sodalis ligni TaxID=2697027 RepID=UPI0030B81745